MAASWRGAVPKILGYFCYGQYPRVEFGQMAVCLIDEEDAHAGQMAQMPDGPGDAIAMADGPDARWPSVEHQRYSTRAPRKN